jgi:hypothetical protein
MGPLSSLPLELVADGQVYVESVSVLDWRKDSEV